jgi:hypothetical protein
MADTCYTEQLPKKFLCASALFLTLTLPLFLFQGGVNHDEVEHLAVAYRVLSGDLPYRDFHQNHLPGIWFTLLGWLAVFDGSVFPLYLGRCISISLVLLPAILSVSLLRRLTDCPNALRTLQAVFCLLILTLAPSVEAYRIRPDAWSAGLSAIGFYFLVRPGRCSYVRCMFVGILMGFAASFTFKTFPLFAVVVFALFSDIQFQALPQKISAVGVFFIGTLLGCLPLIAYLHNFDLWVEFYQQVIELNLSYARPKTIWYAFIDHVAFFAAVSAAMYIFATQKSLSVEKRKILTTAAAWILVSYGSLAIANNHAFYNFQAIIVPATVALAYFFVETISHCNKPAIQRVLCFWLVASCLWATYTDIIRKKHPHGGISLSQFF